MAIWRDRAPRMRARSNRVTFMELPREGGAKEGPIINLSAPIRGASGILAHPYLHIAGRRWPRPAVSPMVEAYCVKCRAKREMTNPERVTLKNGKPALKDVCPMCGTGLFRIGG